MKAISTLIATILMLAITTALAGTAYLFISGVLTGKISTSFSLVYSYTNTVTIRNDGTAPITSFTKVTVDGKPAIYSVTAQDSSLAGYWKFDEDYPSQTASDSSDKGNIGTLGSTVNPDTNDPSWASKSGSALQFNGSNKYVQIVDSPSLRFTSFTLEAWIYGRELGSFQRIFNGGDAFYLFRITPGNVYELGIWTGTAWLTCGFGTFTSNTWHHVAVTHDSSTNRQKIYIDGSQEGIDCAFTASPRYGNIYIGGNQVNENFNGIIDEVRIYNRALSQSEVQSRFQGQDIRSGLVAELSFNEASGTKTSDSSGNNNNGDLLPANSAPTWTSRYGSALRFDGVNDYVNSGNDASLNITGDMSVSWWFKADSLPPNSGGWPSQFRAFVRLGDNSPYALYLYTDGLGTRILDSHLLEDSTWNGVISTPGLTKNQWYHVVWVHNGFDNILYVNGIYDNRWTQSLASRTSPGQNLFIGSQTGTAVYFNGTIDEVRVYNRALSAGEISAIYQSNFGDIILPGSAADVKILTPLSTGTRTVKICTPSICNTAYLIIT